MTTVGAYSDAEYVFEPHSRNMPDVRKYVAALWTRRQFLVELARADLRADRSRKKLGNLWSVFDPLFQALVYFFLYNVLRPGARTGFLPILIGGIFLFQLSMASFTEAGSSIKRGRGLMLKSTFPRALLPLSTLFKVYRRFIPSACVFLVLFPLVGGRFGAGVFVLPLIFALQIVMNVGIALLVSTYVTLVPDGTNMIQYLTRLLFFATPVIYPISILPPGARLLVFWQPLFPLFASYQAILSGGVPSFSLILQTTLWAFALLAIGIRVFLRREREFAIHL
jgi:teichoic acid transport system permease protein